MKVYLQPCQGLGYGPRPLIWFTKLAPTLLVTKNDVYLLTNAPFVTSSHVSSACARVAHVELSLHPKDADPCMDMLTIPHTCFAKLM